MSIAHPRRRLNIFVEPGHARRLQELAAHRGVSQSSVIAAALSAFLSPEDVREREAVVMRRLDQLSRQFVRLEREQHILIETVALFVRVFLTVSLPVPEGQQEAARAQGRARYAQFIEQLGRHLQRGHALARELHAAFDGEDDDGSPGGGVAPADAAGAKEADDGAAP